MRSANKVLAGKPEWKRQFVDINTDGRILLKWIL
jgi:hypothetical protein